MKKLRATSGSEWLELEKRDHAEVVRALLNFRPFLETITYQARGGDGGMHPQPLDRDRTPRKTFTCPKGHPILQVSLQIDRHGNVAKPSDDPFRGLWEIDLTCPHGDQWVPFSEWRMRSASVNWGERRGEGWYCYYEDEQGNHCDVVLPWGSKYCDEHADQPDPSVPEVPYDEKVVIVCPEPDCTYRGVQRRSSLLVEYALACVTRRQHIKLSS